MPRVLIAALLFTLHAVTTAAITPTGGNLLLAQVGPVYMPISTVKTPSNRSRSTSLMR